METTSAIAALGALAHEGRLAAFRLLVKAGPQGLAAGAIARAAGALPNTLSANLRVLSGAGLINAERQGRSIVYRADFSQMQALLAFLLEDCCGGDPAICAPLVQIASRCCATESRPC